MNKVIKKSYFFQIFLKVLGWNLYYLGTRRVISVYLHLSWISQKQANSFISLSLLDRLIMRRFNMGCPNFNLLKKYKKIVVSKFGTSSSSLYLVYSAHKKLWSRFREEKTGSKSAIIPIKESATKESLDSRKIKRSSCNE